MAVSALASLGGAVDASAPAGSGAADAEQRFLKLLVTQLNNQDPLNPLDNAQLTSQLAQMSTVSGIEKLNAALQSLIAQSGAGQVLQAASLIGRHVLVPGNEVAVRDGTPAVFAIETAGGADKVAIDIVDRSGALVRHIDADSFPAGVQQLAWDGTGDNGQAVAPGTYRVAVAAAQGGAPVAAGVLTFQRVQSVAQGGAGITLDTGGAPAALADVRLIQ